MSHSEYSPLLFFRRWFSSFLFVSSLCNGNVIYVFYFTAIATIAARRTAALAATTMTVPTVTVPPPPPPLLRPTLAVPVLPQARPLPSHVKEVTARHQRCRRSQQPKRQSATCFVTRPCSPKLSVSHPWKPSQCRRRRCRLLSLAKRLSPLLTTLTRTTARWPWEVRQP